MLWESLAQDGRERDYVRVLGRTSSARLVAVAGASLAGGFLYQVDPRLPFLAAAVAFGAAAVTGLWLREAKPSARLRTAPAVAGTPLTLAWRITLPLLVVGSFLAVTEEVLDDVLSVEFGFSPAGLGALLAAAYLGAAAAARVAHRLEGGIGRRPLIFGMAMLDALSLAVSPLLGFAGGGITVCARHAFRSVHDTVAMGQLAATADPSRRATLLSIYQAARRLPYVVLAFYLGGLMDRITARGFALWFGIAMAAVTMIAWRASVTSREPLPPAPS
jgi:hypothetical protein